MELEQITEGPLLVDLSDGVATLTINDAPYNRLTLGFMDSLDEAVDQIRHDDRVRSVVITAAGEANFSVGMNLKELGPGIKAKGGIDELFDQRLDVLDRIETLEKPCIATLFGNCLGGGLELPLACHFRLAAEEGAQIGLPELDLGTVPAWGGTPRLTRCVGRDHALDMILRAKKISGPDALRIGLVTEVWPLVELKSRAQDLARELAAMPACGGRRGDAHGHRIRRVNPGGVTSRGAGRRARDLREPGCGRGDGRVHREAKAGVRARGSLSSGPLQSRIPLIRFKVSPS